MSMFIQTTNSKGADTLLVHRLVGFFVMYIVSNGVAQFIW